MIKRFIKFLSCSALILAFACTAEKQPSQEPDAEEFSFVDANSSLCGNGVCDGGESAANCPQDCTGTICTETCQYSMDGECDDGGPNADFDECPLGTDCADCSGSGPTCDNSSDGVCPSGCPLDPDCGGECVPDCTPGQCGGGDGCGDTCGCSGSLICENFQCTEDTSVVNVGATCSACDGQIFGLRCLAPNQQAQCGGDPSNGGNGWCTRSNLDSNGYCTKMCSVNADCPSNFACIDASGGRFCLLN